ncbi:hypothetical protein NL676_021260 [Syzygium grande]|nr:hypothetical protein NL676_021260 [Syzygium grande]
MCLESKAKRGERRAASEVRAIEASGAKRARAANGEAAKRAAKREGRSGAKRRVKGKRERRAPNGARTANVTSDTSFEWP